jgi:3-deoxy-7-phosphoheptulonate synthase
MTLTTDNLRIVNRKGLIPPIIMLEEFPLSERAANTISEARTTISNIIHGTDDRLLVLCGPCSIHDYDAAIEYGKRLKPLAEKYSDTLFIVMRVYFEKPRTTVGWKGFINDPDLDGSFQINKGLKLARQLLTELSDMGLPCGTEYLDTISPQFVADCIAWGAIGARTTESQVHRELASGLSCPVGFKNGTDGNVQVAIDAMGAARSGHHFLSVTKQGNTAIYETAGNTDTHVILRGGATGPNYDEASVQAVVDKLKAKNVPYRLMVDCSHGNSEKDYRNQPKVAGSVAKQRAGGNTDIMGVMLESHLEAGNQNIDAQPLIYGKSITDSCMDWGTTEEVLALLG